MSSSAVVKHGPPSPPLSENRELQHGFNSLMQHNAATQYRPDPYAMEHGTYFQSGSNTTFSSPEPSHSGFDQYGRSHYHTAYPDQQDMRLGYDSPMYYSNPVSDYHGHPPPQHSQYPDQGYYTYDLPTPMTSDQGSGVTRIAGNGRLVVPNGSPQAARGNSQERSRSSNTPRAKRTSKQKSEKAKIPKIDAPLSELTKKMDDVPVKDMHEWVNRSAEVRRAEVVKRQGYVARPMNSFMLYRSAYAERTKIWCLQNNHQVVSSVSGESWPLEPPEIRDRYSEYARVERDNHAKAHPGYKFSPSKAQTPGRKRKGASEDIEEEPSDLDDPDYEWRPKTGKRARAKRAKGSSQDPNYPSSSTSLDEFGMGGFDRSMGQNRSSYQFTNPGKAPPKQIDVDALYNQYYQTNTYPSSMGSNVEDVVIRKTETPSMQYGTAQPLVGLPGAHHYELLDQQIFDHGPAALNDPQVDPLLLAYDNEYPGHQNDFIAEQQVQDDQDQARLFGTDPQMGSHQDGLPLHPESDQWQFGGHPGQSEGLLDDFDEFMGMHNNR